MDKEGMFTFMVVMIQRIFSIKGDPPTVLDLHPNLLAIA
jgi:hypothetical protein